MFWHYHLFLINIIFIIDLVMWKISNIFPVVIG